MQVTATPDGGVTRHWDVFRVREASCPRCGDELRQLRQQSWAHGPGVLRCQNAAPGGGKCNQPILIDIFNSGTLCIVVMIPTTDLYHRYRQEMGEGKLDATRALDELGVVASGRRGDR